MNKKIFPLLVLAAVLLSACNNKSTKYVSIRYTEEDTTTRIKFLATIITGDDSKSFTTETPYKLEFTDQSFIVTAYPESDSVSLFMESWGNDKRSSRTKGWAHSGTIYYIKPNSGPGYMGNPK